MKAPCDIFIAGISTALAPAVTVETALQQGMVANEVAKDVGVIQLPSAIEPGAPLLAVDAARTALEYASVAAVDVQLLVHAWIHHQGHDFWSPSHYVAREIGAVSALPVGLQTMCNGAETGIEIAMTRLASDSAASVAIVTTADVFAGDFDRWNSDSYLWYGDAGTAIVLTTEYHASHPKLLACVATTVLAGEGMHRGDDPFSWEPRQKGSIINVRRTKKAHLQSELGGNFGETMYETLRSVVLTAVAEAGLLPESSNIRYLALPRLGRKITDEMYVPAVENLTKAEIMYLGNESGHLGAGDTTANLYDLLQRREHSPGDIALLVCAGGGFTVSCIAVELGLPGAAIDISFENPRSPS